MTDFTVVTDPPRHPSIPAVSWSAVLAGVIAASALSVILFAVGGGLGLAAATPWSSAGAVGIGAGVWLVVTQWLASALGGYLAGRLRTRWIGTHAHEVHFRDTAHGLLTWAGATLVAVAIATLGAGAAGERALEAAEAGYAHDADALYRSVSGDITATQAARDEAARILASASASGGAISTQDSAYLAASVATRAGLTPSDAQARVDAVVTREARAAETARKDAAALAFLTAIALLVGAFIASVAAALGGHQREEHP